MVGCAQAGELGRQRRDEGRRGGRDEQKKRGPTHCPEGCSVRLGQGPQQRPRMAWPWHVAFVPTDGLRATARQPGERQGVSAGHGAGRAALLTWRHSFRLVLPPPRLHWLALLCARKNKCLEPPSMFCNLQKKRRARLRRAPPLRRARAPAAPRDRQRQHAFAPPALQRPRAARPRAAHASRAARARRREAPRELAVRRDEHAQQRPRPRAAAPRARARARARVQRLQQRPRRTRGMRRGAEDSREARADARGQRERREARERGEQPGYLRGGRGVSD